MKAGDRVEMTEAALKERLDGKKHDTTGTVVGFGECGLLKIRRDKYKAVDQWHPTFWRLAK